MEKKSGNIKCSGQISTRLDALLKKHHLFPPNNDPTDIWWDLENCLPPTDVKEESIYGRIKRALRLRNYTGKINIRALFAYEDSDQIPLEMQRKLQSSKIGIRNLGFIKSNNENQHPKPAPDEADDAIKLEINEWISIDGNAPPRNIMIISGDHKGFEMKLKELSDLKYRTLAVFRPGGSNQEKINPHVFDSWFLRDFLGLPEKQGKRKFYGTLKGFKDSSDEDEEEIQKKRAKKNERLEKPTENFTDIGGLKNQIQELVEAIVSPIKGKSKVLDDDPPAKGVLLSGPAGTGKTLMARACAAQINASFLKLDGPQLVQPDGSKQILREAFELAKENAPCIIFIDKIDAIATTRVTKGRNAQKTLVELFNQLRELGHNDLVKVIATTNHADILRQELIHAKRLDRKIEIPLPTEEARADILQIHSREMNVNPDVKFEELARSTDGFNGAQLKAVCVEAGMLAATDVVNRENFNESIIQVQGKKGKPGDLVGVNTDSYSRVKAKEVDEKATKNYTDIGGLKNQIQELVQAIGRPITGKGDELDDDPPAKGVLLSGPAGTGKTLMARACAAQINASFVKLDGPQLVRPDGSKKFFREAFELAQKNVPCIIFIDKIDAIATTRVTKNAQKTLGELFFQLRELGHYDHVKVIATTNHADILHEDLIHAERLDRKIEIPLPTEEARADILQIHSREMNVNPDVKFEELARSTDGFNGAQLKAVCVEADMFALLRDATEVHHEDFKEGIIQVQQAVKEASLNY